MWILSSQPSFLTFVVLALSTTRISVAKPIRDYVDGPELLNATIVKRCDNPCGWSGQVCCAAGQTCFTDSNDQAQCGDVSGGNQITAAATTGGSGGYWQLYTSTWIDTSYVTKTAVFSSYVPGTGTVTAGAAPTPSCDYASNETPCGDICCASGQYCAHAGQCKDAGNGGRTTTGLGGTFSPPLRPTTGTYITSTATVSPTTTVAFGTPVATGANVTITGSESSGGGGGGLSGGAIAGIVIGVLLGIALLLLLCFCCIARGLWALVAGIFGFGKKERRRREETTYIEEHHHHGSASAAAGRRWYGDRPSRRSRSPVRKSRFGWAAAGLGALGLGLAGKKALDKRRARRDEKSDISSSYYYYSDEYSYTSPSSMSSDDRRTRRSSRK